MNLSEIGLVYKDWGQYDNAIKYYKQALELSSKLGRDDFIATSLNSIGLVYYKWAQYDKALKYYQQALEIDKKLGIENAVAGDLNCIGGVYNAWGQYDKAIKNYRQALEINRKQGKEGNVALNLNNIGMVYSDLGQYDKALKYLQQALEIFRKLGNEKNVAGGLNNIGLVYYYLGQYDKAIKHFQQALEIFKKRGIESQIAMSRHNIGMVYSAWGQYENALKHLQQALMIARKMSMNNAVAINLHNIGVLFYKQVKYSLAIQNLSESIEIKEKLRTTATGDTRRDYLASQIHTYHVLISAQIRNNNASDSFKAMEISRAKLLAERMAEDGAIINIPTSGEISKKLEDSTAVLVYANTDYINLSQIVLTKNSIQAKEISSKEFVISAIKKYEEPIRIMVKNQRGIEIVKKKKEELQISKKEKKSDFENIINYYRSLLTDPSIGEIKGLQISRRNNQSTGSHTYEISRMLYDFLIKPMESEIKGKKELIIIPDGILAFIPFETLIDENGKYLIEKYNIKYTQSMGILKLIEKRRYSKNRNHYWLLGELFTMKLITRRV